MTPTELLALLEEVAHADAGWTAMCPAWSTTAAPGIYRNVRAHLVIECDAGCPLADVLDAIEARRTGRP